MEQDKVIELLLESATLLAVGMSVVFVFLTLLIVSVNGIAAFCRKFPGQPESPMPVQGGRLGQGAKAGSESPDDVIVAITAAIHQHRNR